MPTFFLLPDLMVTEISWKKRAYMDVRKRCTPPLIETQVRAKSSLGKQGVIDALSAGGRRMKLGVYNIDQKRII